MSASANELYRRLRELWTEDFERVLRRIAPELLSGSIPAGALPRGTMINRGPYSATATYRPGDLVVGADGSAYVALLASAGVSLGDTATWERIGGPTVPPPPDTYAYVVDSDGAYVIDADGAYVITFAI